MKTISVIIPTYQDGERLRRNLVRLREIQRREYPALEIIVSVRPSEDMTLEVAERFADKVVLTEGLVSESRNNGGAAATGEVLLFLDADAVPNFGTLRKISAAAKPGTMGTCASFPHPFSLRALLAISCQNTLRALHLVKGANLLFCHRSIFFDKGIRYDPERNLGEHHDFVQRAVTSGARYRYLRIPKGYEVDVGRYDTLGYLRTFCFWIMYSLSKLLHADAFIQECTRLYWNKNERMSYASLFRPLLRTAGQGVRKLATLLLFGFAALMALASSFN